MSNGLTLSYPGQRQELSAPVLLLLALLVFGLHLLILMLASIPPVTLKAPPQERQLRISLAPMLMPLPDNEVTEPKSTPERKAPETSEAPAALPIPAKDEEIPEQPASQPPPPESKQPDLQPETASPEIHEPNLAPLVNVRVADDTAAGQEKPPEHALYEGATNTEAADRSRKEKIGPDPKVDGESGELRFAGRRGETENPLAQREPPNAGSIETEGAPQPGKPLEAQQQVAPLPEPEPARIPIPAPKAESREPVQAARTEQPKIQPDHDETAATKDPEPDGLDPLKQATPVQDQEKRMAQADTLIAVAEPEPNEPKENVKRPAPAVQDLAQAPRPVPEPIDPELARLQKLLDRPQAAPDNAIRNPGAGTRKGQIGHEGDGRMREGELNAVSDIMAATMTSAAKEGDVAFSKRATPENAYLKPFFRRMDAKWKAVFFSDNRALSRLEFGEVEIRFTFDKTGQLTDVAEVSRRGTVSDRAVHACLEGMRRAAPHDAFPPALGDREKLTETVMFLYR